MAHGCADGGDVSADNAAGFRVELYRLLVRYIYGDVEHNETAVEHGGSL